MGMFKFFDMPQKEPGEALTTADWFYLIKLMVATAFFTITLTLLGVQLLLERHIHRMDKSAKTMMEWSKKADFANEMLEDMFRVQQTKEAYERQGVGAEEAIIKPKNKEENYETKD